MIVESTDTSVICPAVRRTKQVLHLASIVTLYLDDVEIQDLTPVP